jgi:hypothetical protein
MQVRALLNANAGGRGDLELKPVFSQICADDFGDCNVLMFD